MSAENLAVRTWRVKKRTCTLTVHRSDAGSVGRLEVEWKPSRPSNLTSKELRQYRAGRDAALASLSAELGFPALVIEL